MILFEDRHQDAHDHRGHDGEEADRAVLALQIGERPREDGVRHLLHFRRSLIAPEHILRQPAGKQDG